MGDDIFKNGKKAAFCMSVDDVAPLYVASGDADFYKKRLDMLMWLMSRHKQIKITLFVTADWREINFKPERKLLAAIPHLREKFYLVKRLPKNTLRIDAHSEFISLIKASERFEVALHGLTHTHKGLSIPVEFQNESKGEILKTLDEMFAIFNSSGLDYVRGFCPPAWNAPRNLLDALIERGVKFISSGRDLFTAISKNAKTDMSGMRGVPLISPCKIEGGKMVHFPINFQATSFAERAFEIVESGGLVSVKGHFSEGMLDTTGQLYLNYLDLLLSKLEDKYGDSIFWTSMGEMTNLILQDDC